MQISKKNVNQINKASKYKSIGLTNKLTKNDIETLGGRK